MLNRTKKRGHRRDISLLTDILTTLFWRRDSPKRSVNDLLSSLLLKYEKLIPDTRQDNLEYLSEIPDNEPFVKISTEKDEVTIYHDLLDNTDRTNIKLAGKKEGRPSNIYTLNNYYINDYYGKDLAFKSGGVTAYVVDSTPEGQRVQALEERVKKGGQAAVDKLLQVLSSDARPDARWKAAQALGRLNEKRALKQLETACNDPEEKVCNAAKNALEKIKKGI